jgi:hypothetical protein
MKYITLKDMGSSGGLCSQLQIFASLQAVAKANNMKIAFSEEMIRGQTVKYPHTQEEMQTSIRVFDLVELDYEIKSPDFFLDFKDKPINFHTTTYDETLFTLDQSYNYNLVGRFDLYTYWYYTIGEVVERWEYKKALQDNAAERISEIRKRFGNDRQIVSVHIRRGDYLLPQFSFCELDTDYYTKAIVDHFLPIEDYNFLIFSNDIDFAKQLIEGDNVVFVDPIGGEKVCTDSEKEDLALMSLCNHHITANSSYSWWGAFLNKNKGKKIICPTNWLRASHPSSWINGRYFPPTWINIDNLN